MGLLAVAVVAALAAKGRKPAQLDPNCIVTSILPDGTEEPRECYSMGVEDLKPGTKGVFQSCTQ